MTEDQIECDRELASGVGEMEVIDDEIDISAIRGASVLSSE
jgi:hypothetical protein